MLNVKKNENCWINAVLLGGFEEKFHAEIDKREEGYKRVEVPKNHIVTYDGKIITNDAFIYVGLEYMRDENILPIKSYLDLCIEGAKCYGNEFLQDFLFTTWTRSRVRLDKYKS